LVDGGTVGDSRAVLINIAHLGIITAVQIFFVNSSLGPKKNRTVFPYFVSYCTQLTVSTGTITNCFASEEVFNFRAQSICYLSLHNPTKFSDVLEMLNINSRNVATGEHRLS